MSPVPDIMLNNGQPIPQLGFGVFLVKPEDTAEAVATALEVGYRHIDTAEMYGNEREVGEAIAKSGLDRASVFVTSKLSNASHRPDDARRAFDQTLEALGFDYIDLFLIHWPLPMRYDGDFVSTWQTLGEFYRDGRARSIGVSNFLAHHLRRLHVQSDIPPAVAMSTGKTPAQVVLRWHIERGDIVFPKSVKRARIRENFDIFDFELSADDVAAISALNRDQRTGPDPDTFPG